MSLINQMLKDLEKRRSRDLETSASLNNNITWETRPNQKNFNWFVFSIIIAFIALASVTGYLLWDKISPNQQDTVTAKKIAPIKNIKPVAKKKIIKKKVKKIVVVDNDVENEIVDDAVVNTEELDDVEPIKLEKKHRPLNSKQLSEIAYKKGFRFLQQGRMRQGKEHLREALSLYIPHIKAREMLAGIYIKSGRFINAAELLSEGVKVVPEYPLFAQLYARVLIEQSKPQLAVTILEQGIRTAGVAVEPNYHALLAATYQRVKNHKKAVEIYLRLIKIRPTVGVWWLGLAISLEKSSKNKEALEAYQRAQETGNLKAGLVKFTNNRVSALSEIGFPEK